MKTLTITIQVDIPDGVAVTVGNGATSPPQVAPDAPQSHADAPWPDMPPPDLTSAAGQVFDGMGDLVAHPTSVLHDAPHVAIVPAGSCPIHGPDHWVVSKFGGFYCTAKDESKPKGYCVLKSGSRYRGVVIP